MSESLSNLIEDLVSSCAAGQPALVLVDDYLERAKLAKSITEEASLHAVRVITLSVLEDAKQGLSDPEGREDFAAIILVDPGAAEVWGPWLEANREALPQWVRFLVVLMMPADVPVLSRLAPAFMSWAKGMEIRKLVPSDDIPSSDVDAELARLEKETGMSAETFIDAWKRGEVQPREQSRVAEVVVAKLASADQDRLRQGGLTRGLFAFAVASDSGAASEPLASRFLRLSPGKRLNDGELSFQVFINETTRCPAGMNIQVRGKDPARTERPTYLRYDLDIVPMGTKSGPVTHFNAHWHFGDDPDGSDAEDHDPRLPSLLLDPLAVLDILIETYFPSGPADVTDAADI